MPFLADYLYRELNGEEKSVHLTDWPEVNKKLIDEKLEEQMKQVREICSMALQIRASKGIKVRQPLSELIIPDFKLENELLKLIEEEINVKKIVVDPNRDKSVMSIGLSAEITPELREEGVMRDFIRSIQSKRKEIGLTPKDKIRVYYSENKEIIEKYADQIKKQVIAEDIVFGDEFKIEKV